MKTAEARELTSDEITSRVMKTSTSVVSAGSRLQKPRCAPSSGVSPATKNQISSSPVTTAPVAR